jgi:hypothetical protein
VFDVHPVVLQPSSTCFTGCTSVRFVCLYLPPSEMFEDPNRGLSCTSYMRSAKLNITPFGACQTQKRHDVVLAAKSTCFTGRTSASPAAPRSLCPSKCVLGKQKQAEASSREWLLHSILFSFFLSTHRKPQHASYIN